jgi:hypothetical protein
MRVMRLMVGVLAITEVVRIHAATIPPVIDMDAPSPNHVNCLSFNGTDYPVAAAFSVSELSKRRADNPCWISRAEDIDVALPTDKDLIADGTIVARGSLCLIFRLITRSLA